MRDHESATINEFNGLFDRGDQDSTPLDHFRGSNNIKHKGSNVISRDGLSPDQNINLQVPLQNITRLYNYPTLTKNTIIALSYDRSANIGHIYHCVDSAITYGPVLSISGMKDFAFQPYAGRGYISPFASLPPTLASPTSAPTFGLDSTGSLPFGTYKYRVTFVTSVGETDGGTEGTVVLDSQVLSNPTPSEIRMYLNYYSSIIYTTYPSLLVPGGMYGWRYTLVNKLGQETLPGTPAFVGLDASAPAVEIQLYHTGGTGFTPPDVDSGKADHLNFYRTTAGGATYYKEREILASEWKAAHVNTEGYITKSLQTYVGDKFTDAAIVSNPTLPTVNNTGNPGSINLTNIPTGVSSVIARKIYRTVVNGSTYKLLTTINDNTTTTFHDNTPDGSLGANYSGENTALVAGDVVEKGLNNEFLYVYRGDGSNATKAGGATLAGTMTVAAGAAGHTDAGLHVYGVVSETDTGYLSPPAAFKTFTNLSAQSVSFGSIPTSGDPRVVKRHIVASKKINSYNGDPTGYDLFFIPGADINNNTDTFLNNVSFFDADLLEDASHLFDNYTEIPAGAFLCLYHNRLVLGSTFDDFNRVLVSAAGEPEAISQIDGLLASPPDGNPVSNGAEFRDVLYIFKPARGLSFTDNGDEPATWPLVQLESALGTRPHGIATVLDSGGQNVDFLIICTYQGISLFTGGFQAPELSWKIENFWKGLTRSNFGKIQIINNVIKKRLYIVLPTRTLLVGFYQNGLNPKDIQWEQWTYAQPVNTIAVARISEDIVGCDIY